MPIDKNKEYATASGCEVQIYAIHDGWVHGAYRSGCPGCRWMICEWDLSTGKYGSPATCSPLDLVEKRKPIKLSGVVRVYHNGDKFCIGGTYLTREDAQCHSFMNQTAALIPVTIEGFEGDGL